MARTANMRPAVFPVRRLRQGIGRSLPLAILIVVGSLVLSPSGAFAAPDVIKIGGTGAMMTLLKQLGDAFGRSTGVAVEVLPSLGTSGGLRALSDGVIDVAATARPLTAEEVRKGLQPVLTGRTAFVLVTSHKAPGNVGSADVVAMISSKQAAWPDGTPVRLIIRPRSDSDTLLMEESFPGADEAIEQARQMPENPIAASDSDNAGLAETLPGSIAGATYSQVVAEQRNLRFISVDGVVPTTDAIEQGKYPYKKLLHVVVRSNRGEAVERFVAFLRTPEALDIMRKTGLFPQ